MTTGNKNRRSPAKFRIKRISTNQSYGEGDEYREQEKDKSLKKIENNKSVQVKNAHLGVMSSPKPYESKKSQIENPVMHLLSKRLALKTNS